MSAQKLIQQQIAGKADWGFTPQNKTATQTQPGGGCGRLATMITLRPARCNQMVTPLRQGVGYQKLQFPGLITP
jgi:hypothetical protein